MKNLALFAFAMSVTLPLARAMIPVTGQFPTGRYIPNLHRWVSDSSLSSSVSSSSSTTSAVSSSTSKSPISAITNGDPDADGTVLHDMTRKDIGAFSFRGSCGPSMATIRSIIFTVNSINMSLDPQQFNVHPTGTFSGMHCSALTSHGTPLPIGTGVFMVSCDLLHFSVPSCGALTLQLQGFVRNSRLDDTQASSVTVSFAQFNDQKLKYFGYDSSHLTWVESGAGKSLTHFWLDYPTNLITSSTYTGVVHHVFK